MLKQKLLYVLLLSGILFLSYCAEKPRPIPKSMKEQLALLPSDANALGYINVKKMHESEFGKAFIDSARHNPFHNEEYEDFVSKTGLDLEKDITEVYGAAYIGEDYRKKDVLLVINGKFDPEKILNYLKNKSDVQFEEKSSYDGNDIYMVGDKDTLTFSFIDNSTLLVGNEVRIEEWIDKSKTTQGAPDNQLISQIDKLKYKDSAWFTMDTKLLAKQMHKQNNKKLKSLESIERFSISADLNENLRIYCESVFISNEKAKLFYDAAKGVIAAGKLSVTDDREIIDILNAIDVSQDGDIVTIDMKLNKQEIEKLKNKKDDIDETIFSSL